LNLKKTLYKSLFTNYAGLTSACIAKQECTLMHARTSFIQYLILLATFSVLAACTDSSTTETPAVPIIEEALFPFIQDHTLYNFNPETGIKEKLAESNKSLMIGLDIDQSTQVAEDDGDSGSVVTLNQTALPEYVVYVKNQTLRLYDLHTRHDHLLTNFAATNEQNTDEFICDLRPTITVDQEHLNKNEILFKNEASVYIKTSAIESCTGTPSSFQYFQIKIEDSFTETFEIRRTTLLKHEHFHTHQHEHDYDHDNDHEGDHDHDADAHLSDPTNGDLHSIDGHQVEHISPGDPDYPEDADGSILPKYPNEVPHDHSHNDTKIDKLHTHKHSESVLNSGNRKFHEHKHEHEHDFKYIIMDEHKFNDDPETSPDKVHSNPINQLTQAETLPVLVGKKHVVDSALMYAGNPIVDLRNKRFGYLGFNNSDPESDEASYKFFEAEAVEDGDEKIELWSMTNSEFSVQPEDYWGYIETKFSDAVMIEFNWKMVKWDLEGLFDDDKTTERQSSIDNPMFNRTHTPEAIYNRAWYSINQTSDTIAIYDIIQEITQDEVTQEESTQEIETLYTVSNEGTQTLVRNFRDVNLDYFNFILLPNDIITLKNFADDSGYLGASLTNTNLSSRLEQTLNPISASIRAVAYSDNSFAISTQDHDDSRWNANYFSSSIIRRFSLDLENATWGALQDQRTLSSNPYSFAPILLHANTIEGDPTLSTTALSEPDVYLFNQLNPNDKGEFLGTVPTMVTFAYNAIIHNELFAQITIQETLTPPNTYKTYYFNPDDPTTEMELMYEEVFNE